MKTKYFSYKAGNLAKGCQLCVQGRKTVLFITGLCAARCFFCPISDQKRNKDVIYANEKPIKKVAELIEEAKLCSSKGVGITGGDPLVRLNRTISYIKALKKKFGKKFHIHLYTPFNLVTKDKLGKLYKAGLDEIRFHADLYSNKLWPRIELAAKFNWDVGVEIPVIPGREKITKELIDFLAGKVKFLNLNELEISDTNANKLLQHGFKPKNRISYGVKGSQELALKLLKYAQNKIKNVHYCTTTLKDKVQLANRIKHRAKNVAQAFDRITSEGILVRGAIYLPELKPSFGYRKKVERANKEVMLRKLAKLRTNIIKQHNIPANMVIVDKQRLRLLTSEKLVKKIRGQITAIVKEYPTYDIFEIEIDFLEKYKNI